MATSPGTSNGDRTAHARCRLSSSFYSDLQRVARSLMARERGDHTLAPTEIVHEAYLRLQANPPRQPFARGELLAIAARVMRQILVDHARRKGAKRHGHTLLRVELPDVAEDRNLSVVEVLALESAIDELRELDERRARVVELRFYGGLTLDETAAAMGVAQPTIVRDWRLARAFLKVRLSPPDDGEPGESGVRE